jgi:hypothetical protein
MKNKALDVSTVIPAGLKVEYLTGDTAFKAQQVAAFTGIHPVILEMGRTAHRGVGESCPVQARGRQDERSGRGYPRQKGRDMSCRKPCGGCAFTEGTAANREPYNALKAQICLMGGIPFHCHHNIEWWKPEEHKKKTREQVQKMEICRGWQREVAQLAATGYFKTLRAEKKVYGELGLGARDFRPWLQV